MWRVSARVCYRRHFKMRPLLCYPSQWQFAQRPLHYAARNGELEVMRFLVDECGMDINAPDEVCCGSYILLATCD